MDDFQPLDPITCPLEGFHLIEASAGTGKTWNICALYVRLLLERGLKVQEILVVTFTKAATAELRDRIRTRVSDVLEGVLHGTPNDPSISRLLQHLEVLGLDRETLRDRLRLARESFDEAAISTIHGFCQRALGEMPFSAGEPFDLEVVEDDFEEIHEAVKDFWRQHISFGSAEITDVAAPSGKEDLPGFHHEPMTRVFCEYLIDKGDSPERYAKLLKQVLAQPMSRHLWPEAIKTRYEPLVESLQIRCAEAKEIWAQDDGAEIEDRLIKALGDQILNRRSYTVEKIREGHAAWRVFLETQGTSGPILARSIKPLELLTTSKLAVGKGTRTGKLAPEHPFFERADQILRLMGELEISLQYARLRVIRNMILDVPGRIRQCRRRRRVVSYDDMLGNLHHALHGMEGEALSRALKTRYPAALIDEFQDTDPLQYGIFKSIYLSDDPEKSSLFVVGDPKQAIYRFRNADLNTYLQAQKEARHKHSLSNNQRSVSGLIGAINVLFASNDRAFLEKGIVYREVGLGQKQESLPPLIDQSGIARGDLQIWTLGDPQHGVPTRNEAYELSASATAQEIVRLLKASRAGQIQIKDQPLSAGHIAVLVRSHGQGKRMRRVLEERGVACVELSMDSVWTTLEAEELERILVAVFEKRDDLLRTALSTDLLGGTSEVLEALDREEFRFFESVERFSNYFEVWERLGFSVMFSTLLRDEAVEVRLLQRPDGERRLTNLLHIGELLAEASQVHEGIDALLGWMSRCRLNADSGEAAQLRLESDSQRVRIITIHKSKGLEYDFVFCPFLWDGYRHPVQRVPEIRQYYDPEIKQSVTDFDGARHEDGTYQALLLREDSAETLRLIYVALTRAVYRCYLMAGCYGSATKTGLSHGEASASMLNWLVLGKGWSHSDWMGMKKENPISPEAIQRGWRALATSCSSTVEARLSVDPMPSDWVGETLDRSGPDQQYKALPFNRTLVPGWSRGSFSQMIRARRPVEPERDFETDEGDSVMNSVVPPHIGENDILRFPQGALAGNCLHTLFEHADFSAPASEVDSFDRALRAFPQPGNQPFGMQLRSVLQDVVDTLLPDNAGGWFRLAEVNSSMELRELSFTLALKNLDAASFNAWARKEGLDFPVLTFTLISGYMSGAIDLIFREKGRYYLLDWKSNHLGYEIVDYHRPRLKVEMQRHAYELQALIYTLALHRYLGTRLMDYDYERDFGGFYYLFIRGVRPKWKDGDGYPTGVHFDRISEKVLLSFDALIGESV